MLDDFVKRNWLELLAYPASYAVWRLQIRARHGNEISFRTDLEEADPHTGETILRIP